MAPPSGADTLEVRQRYLRKHRPHPFDFRSRTAFWVVVGGATAWLCIGGFAVFLFGS
jgi:hypothetical protein